jgi:hypothetical protein
MLSESWTGVKQVPMHASAPVRHLLGIGNRVAPTMLGRYSQTRSLNSAEKHASRRRQPIVLELLTQCHLGQLPGRGVGQLFDEDHVVGNAPARDFAFVELEHRIPADFGA